MQLNLPAGSDDGAVPRSVAYNVTFPTGTQIDAQRNTFIFPHDANYGPSSASSCIAAPKIRLPDSVQINNSSSENAVFVTFPDPDIQIKALSLPYGTEINAIDSNSNEVEVVFPPSTCVTPDGHLAIDTDAIRFPPGCRVGHDGSVALPPGSQPPRAGSGQSLRYVPVQGAPSTGRKGPAGLTVVNGSLCFSDPPGTPILTGDFTFEQGSQLLSNGVLAGLDVADGVL